MLVAVPRPDTPTAILPPGIPIRLAGGRDGVLLIHGYLGSPNELRMLADHLNRAGMTVLAPRLPGHATDRYDLRQTDWRHWLRAVTDAYLELDALCDCVYVAGLSMGAVLTTLLARRFKPQRIALCAPAFNMNRRWLPLTPLVAPFIDRLPNRSYEVQSEDPHLAEMERRYWAYTWIRPAASLYRLKRMGRAALPHVSCPTLIIVSRNDTVVPVGVADYVRRRLGNVEQRLIVLEESGHVITDDVDREQVAAAILDWFSQ